MKNPLVYDEAPPVAGFADLPSHNKLLPITAQLKQLSQERVRSDKEFQFLVEDLALAKQNANKVSLNEEVRRKELAAGKLRTATREAERTRLAKVQASKDKVVPIALMSEKPSHFASLKRSAKTRGPVSSSSNPHPDPIRNEALNILEDFTNIADQSAAR